MASIGRRTEFDATRLENEALQLHLACVDLAALPALPGASLLRQAQIAQAEERPQDAIDALRGYLTQYGLRFSEEHPIDHDRLALLKKLRSVSQKDLSFAICLSSARLCQFERKAGRLDFLRLLVIAEVLNVEPWQLVGERRPRVVEASGQIRIRRNAGGSARA